MVDSYEAAEAVMSRIGKIKMSDSTIWRRVAKWDECFIEVEQAQREQANRLPLRNELLRPEQQQTGRMGAAMDGAMVHLVEEGWKELKVGCLFDLEERATFDKERHEWVDMAHAVNNSYVAHLGGPEPFGQLVWSEAQSRGWEYHFETQVVGDGAVWIWNLAEQHFFDSRQTVDWYHASQHLHAAAQLTTSMTRLALNGGITKLKPVFFKVRLNKSLLIYGNALCNCPKLLRCWAPKPVISKTTNDA